MSESTTHDLSKAPGARTTELSDVARPGAAGCPPVAATLAGDAEPVIEVRDLTKRYGTHTIHEHLDLTVRQSEIIALVGGSGSGSHPHLTLPTHNLVPRSIVQRSYKHQNR